MRTLFLFDRHELADFRSGKPFDLTVGGALFTLQAEFPARHKTAAAAATTPKKPKRARREHSATFKRKVARYAMAHTAEAAVRKFHVVRSLVSRWKQQQEAA